MVVPPRSTSVVYPRSDFPGLKVVVTCLVRSLCGVPDPPRGRTIH